MSTDHPLARKVQTCLLSWSTSPGMSLDEGEQERDSACSSWNDVSRRIAYRKEHRREFALVDACARGDVEAAADCIRHTDLNWCDQMEGGETALHEACAGGHLACVKLLLRAGASITAEDASGACALRVAVGADTRDLLLLAEHKLGLMRNARPGVVAYFRYV